MFKKIFIIITLAFLDAVIMLCVGLASNLSVRMISPTSEVLAMIVGMFGVLFSSTYIRFNHRFRTSL